ncbi:MAG TPA: hypothetical protein PLS53_13725, partial [Thermoanaerobaculaceae bacterium]|nr:hypothetical protein [Thermoanaerobaculaceae bacterium]
MAPVEAQKAFLKAPPRTKGEPAIDSGLPQRLCQLEGGGGSPGPPVGGDKLEHPHPAHPPL